MARRSVRVLALAALAGALGCQDYNFNPVGHCLIQPGTRRVTLSSVSTADILFVVDDSGSMAGEQTNLANNFAVFVNALTDANDQRLAAGLDPIDFHIAITSSSVFYNPQVATCSASCPGASGLVCCNNSNQPETQPKRCPGGGGCSGGNSCRTDCTGFGGEQVCCPGANTAPQTYVVTCTAAGTACGDLGTRFEHACSPPAGTGVAHAIGDKYPQGDFVAASGKPRVIHFDADLYRESEPQRTNDINARIAQFQANVNVGTCGSGQEQHLQAARLAIQKALAGQQKETDGTVAQWPHPNAKLVVVIVGDEDDCSSPEDPVLGVVFQLGLPPGADSCTQDASSSNPKRYKTSDFTSVRPSGLLGAGVIASAQDGSCHTDATTGQPVCSPGICCDTACTGNVNVCTSQTCGGQAAGTRLFDFGSKVAALPSDVVDGSICSNFSTVLGQLAEIVKPPSVLKLPTTPASDEVVVLRIATAAGITRNVCTHRAPLNPPPTFAAAVAYPYQWWFAVGENDPTPSPSATRFIYINHQAGTCEANPGETYSADYLGLIPANGCATTADCDANPGPAGAWNCCIGVDAQGTCQPPDAGTPVGSCLCKGTTG